MGSTLRTHYLSSRTLPSRMHCCPRQSLPCKYSLLATVRIFPPSRSHYQPSNVKTLEAWWPYLRPGGVLNLMWFWLLPCAYISIYRAATCLSTGIYCIEDIATGANHKNRYGGGDMAPAGWSHLAHNASYHSPGEACPRCLSMHRLVPQCVYQLSRSGGSRPRVVSAPTHELRHPHECVFLIVAAVRAIFSESKSFFADTLVGHPSYHRYAHVKGRLMHKDRVSHLSHVLVIKKLHTKYQR